MTFWWAPRADESALHHRNGVPGVVSTDDVVEFLSTATALNVRLQLRCDVIFSVVVCWITSVTASMTVDGWTVSVLIELTDETTF
jgi:hypothetical protein